MRSDRGNFQKRLARLELRQREREFKDLASVLANYEALTADQSALVLQRLIRLFQEDRNAGVPLHASLDKLPEPFRSDIYKSLLGEPAKEAIPPDALTTHAAR